MRIRIANPISYLEFNKRQDPKNFYYTDVERFYDSLPSILDGMNIDYDELYIKNNARIIHQKENSIYLAWHTHGTLPNIWHLQAGYMPNYLYFDKNGFGPWSEIVDKCDYKIPVEDVRGGVEDFCSNYISNNTSRIPQPDAATLPDEPYVLVLGQRPDDCVMQFSHIDTMELAHAVTEAYKGTKYKVCTKGHPLEPTMSYSSPGSIQVTGNLHKYIAGASAVYTVNSSSGFEGVIHGKRVFTTGRSDYHWATTELKTVKDIKDSIELLEEPIDNDNRIQFLHYMLNHHFMNVNDTKSIQRKILRAVAEYEQG